MTVLKNVEALEKIFDALSYCSCKFLLLKIYEEFNMIKLLSLYVN